MKVKELMSTDPATCSSREDLSAAAMRMWDRDCGILPVVDDGQLLGVITDRDICMALTFKGAKPSAVIVADVIGGHKVYGCSPDDEVADALKIMGQHQVRRLPVIEDGKLQGLLSMNDVALAAREKGGPTFAEVVGAMQGICAHWSLSAAA